VSRHLFEVGCVLEHIERIASGCESLGNRDLAEYLRTLGPLLKEVQLARPELVATREQIAAFFGDLAEDLDKKSKADKANPGAAAGCFPYVRAGRVVAASIRCGMHLPGYQGELELL
jgi:hypothetical protein